MITLTSVMINRQVRLTRPPWRSELMCCRCPPVKVSSLNDRSHALIPIVDLKAQYQSIKEENGEHINATLESSQFVLGSQVAAVEEDLADCAGGGHGIARNSVTSSV